MLYCLRWLRRRTLWANLCCWRLKLLELDFKAEVRARAVKALCIVQGLGVCAERESQVLLLDSGLMQDDEEEMRM